MRPQGNSNGGQRHIGDGAVEHDKNQRQQQHADGKMAPGHRQAVVNEVKG